MLKYAFIVEIPGINPKEYNAIYQSQDCLNLIIGSPNMEKTEQIVIELIGQGFTMMNFCGAFDEQKINRLKNITGESVKIAAVKYFQEELDKMNKLTSLKEFGIIIEGSESLTEIHIKSDICNINTYFVKDMDMAKDAALKLVEQGSSFIELCGWFKDEMTKDIIDRIKGKVPVGSAGIL